ncbi:tetratricopeptide repeat protein [Pedobacter sp. HMF7647]|uniref:Tetratricopeptide repeat protein n=1 Tax=Hufsiella arboris TaxID=2695275 RepID=A0A7K1Y9V8_9SPHI|nr:tetratricopeptide repeat protein [Hufsiella arboris]MXV51354.1 tetratricopeptide repeat protein [Hufsiella arboris]
MKPISSVFLFFIAIAGVASAQQTKDTTNPYVKLGQKALLDGDFKLAVSNLEKSLPTDSNNASVLYMLGYSYYHSANYPKAVTSFSKVVSLRPQEVSAYYYRGKARNILATQMNTQLTPVEKEKLLQASIRDFTKAIELNAEDMKFYQNRAIANRDYGILKSQKVPKFYDKSTAANAYKSCIADLQHILDLNPARTDIQAEMKKAKVYLANLDN